MKLFSETYYHGSGVDFDKFDFRFMGSGEGHQAHGWGVYLTVSKDVAKEYRNNTIEKHSQGTTSYQVKWTVNGKTYSRKYIKSLFKKFMIENYGVDSDVTYIAIPKFDYGDYDSLNFLKDRLEYWGEPIDAIRDNYVRDTAKSYKAFLDFSEKFNVIPERTYYDGMLATVHVDDDCDFVNENDIVTFTGFGVDTILEDFASEHSDKISLKDLYNLKNTTFGNVYLWISTKTSPEELSMYLLENGIDGISYNGIVDGECLVLFNLDKCKIIEKD